MSATIEEAREMARAMSEAARVYPGKLPPQVTVPMAALMIVEASVMTAPETKRAVVLDAMAMVKRLLGEAG